MKKGQPAWNKGKTMSAEMREKTRRRMLGNKIRLGTKDNEHTRFLKSEALKGNKHLLGYVPTQETRDKISKSNKGKTLGKPRHYIRGAKSHLWRGGITPHNLSIRTGLEYKIWRRAVFERDNYTCIWCGLRSSKGVIVRLNADHIKPFAYFPELRFAIDNGRTLCVDCHRKTPTFAGKIKSYVKKSFY